MKRQSGTPQQPEVHIFFLDRNLGSKQLAEALRKESFVIRVHDEHFKPDEADDVWLASCGRSAWIAITPDRRILNDPITAWLRSRLWAQEYHGDSGDRANSLRNGFADSASWRVSRWHEWRPVNSHFEATFDVRSTTSNTLI